MLVNTDALVLQALQQHEEIFRSKQKLAMTLKMLKGTDERNQTMHLENLLLTISLHDNLLEEWPCVVKKSCFFVVASV